MRKLGISLIVFVLFCFLLKGIAGAQEISYREGISGIKYFVWQEYFQGKRLLKEQGWLYYAGIGGERIFSYDKRVYAQILVFGGQVFYHGGTMGGTPANTHTGYIGCEFIFGGKIPVWFIGVNKEVLLVGSLNSRNWMRDLKTTKIALGYKEYWYSFYAKAGLAFSYKFGESNRLNLEGGSTYTISTFEKADFGGGSEVNLYPKNDWGFFIKAVFETENFILEGGYISIKYKKSDLDETYKSFFQPESKAEFYFINFVFKF